MVAMKVRVGYGLGARSTTNDQEGFTTLVDDLERLGFDSLWVSERVSGEAPDPIVAMSFAAARTQRLKFGMSVMVLPGRNPVLTAKALASLDRMSNGRLLPAFGLGVADPWSSRLRRRALRRARCSTRPPLMRRLWEEDDVHHDGARWHLDGVTVRPKPIRSRSTCGSAARRRRSCAGRPPRRRLAAVVLRRRRRAQGRARSRRPPTPPAARSTPSTSAPSWPTPTARCRRPLAEFILRRRPDLDDPRKIVPASLPELPGLEEMIEAGASKFVVLPLAEPADWTAELEAVAAELLALHN